MTMRHLEKRIDELDKKVNEVELLEKIRAEISNIPLTDTDGKNGHWYREPQAIIDDALQIIDKYKTESE